METFITTIQTYGWSAALLVVGFGFVIFVHELGHFLVAKAVGIRVTQFAIGFGPSLLSWRKGIGLRLGSTESQYLKRLEAFLAPQGDSIERASTPPAPRPQPTMPPTASPALAGHDLDRAQAALGLSETEYRLNLVFLLGGYVKMVGQEDFSAAAASSDPRAFNNKPVWARAAVVSAGVVMNVIFGLLFFIAAFMHGVEFNAPVVGEVAPDSPAALAFAEGHAGNLDYRGLRPGDVILSTNGQEVHDLQDVKMAAALARAKESLVITVRRPGVPRSLRYSMEPQRGPQGLQWVGIEPNSSLRIAPSLLVEALPSELRERLAASGVEPGMSVVAVAGNPVQTFQEFDAAVAARHGEPVTVRFEGAGGQATMRLAAKLAFLYRTQDDASVPHVVGLVPATEVAAVVPDTPAQAAGFQAGDVLVRVNDYDWPTFTEVPKIVRAAEGPVRLTLLRGGTEQTLEATPRKGQLGFYPKATNQPIFVTALPGTPGAELRLTPGSRVLAVDGQPVADLDHVQAALWRAAVAHPTGFQANVEYELNVTGSPTERAVVHVDERMASELAHLAWSQPLPMALFEFDMVTLKGTTPWQAVQIGFVKTRQYMLQVYLTLARLFQGSVPASQLQGPVGIFTTGTVVAERGWAYLFFFLGLISVNLAVINFLPIPIVDGGHMVFLAIEKVKGSPVSEAVQTAALYVGLAIIISLLLFTLYNDVARLAGT